MSPTRAQRAVLRNHTTAAVVALAIAALAGCSQETDPETVSLGARLYGVHCASCHGANLEGQPNWREKGPNGRMPAPPHDDSGHTWRHTDRWLFQVVESGMVPPYVRPGYESDMRGFRDKLSDAEIRAVLAYIKSTWSEETHRKREEFLRTRRAESRSPGLVLDKHFRSK